MGYHKKNRRSIRLKGYDYSQPGWYFLTICVRNQYHLFGEIENGIMQLNPAGIRAEKCWESIPDHFPHTHLHEFIIMPNHVHGIVELLPIKINTVRAKNFSPNINHNSNQTVWANDISPKINTDPNRFIQRKNISGNDFPNIIAQIDYSEKGAENFSPLPLEWETDGRVRSPSKTIGSIVRGFKIGVTKWLRINYPDHFPKSRRIWHRNYYEHIIRNEKSFHRITQYIKNNPKNWGAD